MVQKKGYELLKENVAAFKTPWKSAVIFIIWCLLFLGWIVFFLWFDGLVWYGALLSQLIAALICAAFSYAHIKNVKKYQTKYGKLAYQYFFFHFIMPLCATWAACVFHPLLVGGSTLLPFWLAIIVGAFLLSIRVLTGWHIRLSGFDIVGHGLSIYTVFPEKGGLVSSGIYSYIRHPISLGSLCAALGLAFFRNNLLAILTALIFLIPALTEARLEEKEMTERFGEEHKKYIKNTGILFPRKNIGKFFRLLFFLQTVDK
jgi:protein-S-isoprenylcysteine O-methyltransferase Ste14